VADTDDRTEAATPRRLQKAREEGNVPLTPEAPALAGLAACTLLAMLAGPGLARHLAGQLAVVLAQAHTLDPVAALRATLLAGAALARGDHDGVRAENARHATFGDESKQGDRCNAALFDQAADRQGCSTLALSRSIYKDSAGSSERFAEAARSIAMDEWAQQLAEHSLAREAEKVKEPSTEPEMKL